MIIQIKDILGTWNIIVMVNSSMYWDTYNHKQKMVLGLPIPNVSTSNYICVGFFVLFFLYGNHGQRMYRLAFIHDNLMFLLYLLFFFLLYNKRLCKLGHNICSYSCYTVEGRLLVTTKWKQGNGLLCSSQNMGFCKNGSSHLLHSFNNMASLWIAYL